MDQIVDTILSNNIYLLVAIIFLVVLGFMVIKKMIKLALYALVIFILYLGYLYYIGGDVKHEIEKSIEKGTETIEDVKKEVKKITK